MATQPLSAPLSYSETFRECIAALIQYPLDQVPVIEPTTRGEWNFRWREWLAAHGWLIHSHICDHSPPPSPLIIATLDLGDRRRSAQIVRLGVGRKPRGKVLYYQTLTPAPHLKMVVCVHGYREDCATCDSTSVSRFPRWTRFVAWLKRL